MVQNGWETTINPSREIRLPFGESRAATDRTTHHCRTILADYAIGDRT